MLFDVLLGIQQRMIWVSNALTTAYDEDLESTYLAPKNPNEMLHKWTVSWKTLHMVKCVYIVLKTTFFPKLKYAFLLHISKSHEMFT